MSNKQVRVRIAPSPTGNCHVGTARTALYNYLFARKMNGTFIMRIDDTDTKRSTVESEEGVLDGLRWIGLDWDEGPDVGGNYGPYRQSERLELYKGFVNRLMVEGKAYECFCTPEELAAEREAQTARKEDPRYSGRCLNLSEEEKQALRDEGRKPAIRIKVPDEIIRFHDIIRGNVEADGRLMGDFVIQKSDSIPLYNFATVVDDHVMEISHVIRAAEHISNTFPQVVIYKALDWELPEFAHLVLLLNPDKTKISKRKGAVYLGEFAEMGYLPEAMLNFNAFLGWNPGGEEMEEIFTKEELIELFTLERCTQSNAVFDPVKLDWMNGMWIRKISADDLAQRVLPFMQKAGLISAEPSEADKMYLEQLVSLIHERLPRLDEAPESLAYFYQGWKKEDVEVELFASKKKTPSEIAAILEQAKEVLVEREFKADDLEAAMNDFVKTNEIKKGDLFMPLRVAMTNRKVSPPLFTTMELIGKERVIERLELAAQALKG
ncbi:MAG: glutamate--tRNA ligase [Firmicutes bacterium]|jgi:glutamyl-tRNA synthetase|nr:glutamate--tRNA ligase [Bacillota bacterium]